MAAVKFDRDLDTMRQLEQAVQIVADSSTVFLELIRDDKLETPAAEVSVFLETSVVETYRKSYKLEKLESLVDMQLDCARVLREINTQSVVINEIKRNLAANVPMVCWEGGFWFL